MRYLFLAFMIVLLPLRGWAGDVMAINMAVQQVTVAISLNAAGADAAVRSDMPSDCSMMGVGADSTVSSDDSTASGSSAEPKSTGSFCKDCNTCQLCMALVSQDAVKLSAALFSPDTKPLGWRKGFSNADSSVSLKPPIS